MKWLKHIHPGKDQPEDRANIYLEGPSDDMVFNFRHGAHVLKTELFHMPDGETVFPVKEGMVDKLCKLAVKVHYPAPTASEHVREHTSSDDDGRAPKRPKDETKRPTSFVY